MSTNHQTPQDGWNAFQARKQAGNQPSHDDNQPESFALTREEEQIFDNARNAVGELRKTFETWIVIARGVEAANKRADNIGGKRAFMRVLEQQRLYSALGEKDASVKSTASRLLKILENLPEIEAWRASLSDYQRIHWASPTAIDKHFFQEREREAKRREGAEEQEKPPSPAKRIKELEAANAHLHDELASTIARYESGAPMPEPMWRDDGEPEPVKPRKVRKGFKGVLDAWKAIREALIREALKDEQALTLGELDEFWEVITHDRAELISLLAQDPAPSKAPAAAAKAKKQKPSAAMIAAARAAAAKTKDERRIKKIKLHSSGLAEKVSTGELSLDEAKAVLKKKNDALERSDLSSMEAPAQAVKEAVAPAEASAPAATDAPAAPMTAPAKEPSLAERKRAIAKADVELAERVESGEISLKAAEQELAEREAA
jgi:hypothetical protein